MMRIAIVHSFYSQAQPSGENSMVRAQVAALEKAGHDVLLASSSTDQHRNEPLYSIRSAARVATGRGRSPEAAISDFEPQVVHIHNLFPNFSSQWLQRQTCQLVMTLHNYRFACAAGTLFREGKFCKDCLTGTTANALRYKCYRGSRVATIPLALATRRGGPVLANYQRLDDIIILNEEQRTVARAYFPETRFWKVPNFVTSVEPDSRIARSKRWLYAGRLSEEKGIEWLVRNWRSFRNLDIIGSGPLEDLQRTSQPSIRFLGVRPREVLRRDLASYQGIIIPSIWPEGLPTVALEALSAGTPVTISERVSAAEDLTRDGAGEVFSIDDDGASLSSALARVEADSSQRQTRARAHFERTFSESRWLESIMEIYSSGRRLG